MYKPDGYPATCRASGKSRGAEGHVSSVGDKMIPVVGLHGLNKKGDELVGDYRSMHADEALAYAAQIISAVNDANRYMRMVPPEVRS